VAMEVDRFEPVADSPPLRIKVSAGMLNDALVERIKSLLVRFPGDSQVYLHLGEQRVLRLPDAWSVQAGSGLVAELRVLLGPNAIG